MLFLLFTSLLNLVLRERIGEYNKSQDKYCVDGLEGKGWGNLLRIMKWICWLGMIHHLEGDLMKANPNWQLKGNGDQREENQRHAHILICILTTWWIGLNAKVTQLITIVTFEKGLKKYFDVDYCAWPKLCDTKCTFLEWCIESQNLLWARKK
jgi:hypothetical protein